MKNKFPFLIVLILVSLAGFAQTVNKKSLCNKWYLVKYQHNWVDYSPEEKEQNDYLLLHYNMTYESVSEGEKTNGTWKFNKNHNYFILYDKNQHGLKFIVNQLSTDKMVFNIDIEELEGIDIYYATKKNGSN